MSLADSLFGRPLATSEERAEHVGVAAGIPIFGLDALTSAAYGPETALSLLIPLGVAGIAHLIPIVSVVLILLGIVFFSYRQTIAAYPTGGGADDRLHPDRSGRHHGRSRGRRLRPAVASAAHADAVPDRAGVSCPDQHA